MRTIFQTLLFVLPFTAIPLSQAVADTDSSELRIRGVAPKVCNIASPNATILENASVVDLEISIDDLISETDATVNAWNVSYSYPDAMCNYGATLSLQSSNGGLTVNDAVQTIDGEFLNIVHYVATAKWGSAPELVLDTATDGKSKVSSSISGAHRSELSLTLVSQGSDMPAVTGVYEDSLHMKIAPSP